MAWKVSSLARVVNGWSMNADAARDRHPLGLGANLPEDAIYPINLGDDTGKPLDSANR